MTIIRACRSGDIFDIYAIWSNHHAYGHYGCLSQGMVNGSASKPALRQDTGYMVEKPYLDIAPYLGAFGA